MRCVNGRFAFALLVCSLAAPLAALAQSTPVATPVGTPATIPATTAVSVAVDLAAHKEYMVRTADIMRGGTADLLVFARSYYDLVSPTGFDYRAPWDPQGAELQPRSLAAPATWTDWASAHGELNEGFVAGIPSLAYYDILLDAGVSGA